MTKRDQKKKGQHVKFVEAARELGCSEDESAFDKALKKLATAPKAALSEKPKTKKAGR